MPELLPPSFVPHSPNKLLRGRFGDLQLLQNSARKPQQPPSRRCTGPPFVFWARVACSLGSAGLHASRRPKALPPAGFGGPLWSHPNNTKCTGICVGGKNTSQKWLAPQLCRGRLCWLAHACAPFKVCHLASIAWRRCAPCFSAGGCRECWACSSLGWLVWSSPVALHCEREEELCDQRDQHAVYSCVARLLWGMVVTCAHVLHRRCRGCEQCVE